MVPPQQQDCPYPTSETSSKGGPTLRREAPGVTATAIWYYEQIGLLGEPNRTESGYHEDDLLAARQRV
jgi:DNA-binding transcriptional MerR regulator